MAVIEATRGRLFGLWSEFVTDSVTDHPADPTAEKALSTTAILTVSAISLTGLHFTKNAPPGWWTSNASIGDAELTRLLWWGAMNLLWYVVPAVTVIRVVLRRPLAGFGLEGRGAARHWRLYVAMLAIMLPLVTLTSFTAHFQAIYPFYRPALIDGVSWRLGVWWVVYATQFLSLEFFFRGFMIHGLRPHLGFASIGVMMVPYTMIHFGKPPLEASAAILAGLALGALSLRTRSIWLGALLHISVAGAMDIASLLQAGAL
jgi:membrane protease YdiL (CAAX protease family)